MQPTRSAAVTRVLSKFCGEVQQVARAAQARCHLGRGGTGLGLTLVKAMINLLPKPKVKPPSSPFEEAQW